MRKLEGKIVKFTFVCVCLFPVSVVGNAKISQKLLTSTVFSIVAGL